jgi:hypothetical protein
MLAFDNNYVSSTGTIWISQYAGGCASLVPGASGHYVTEINNAYFWNNARGGDEVALSLNETSCGVAANQNWWTLATSFDGTQGVGRGTTPPTGACTPGVAYWVASEATSTTDPDVIQGGTLYKCTSVNTWSPAYHPYTYPHPLSKL